MAFPPPAPASPPWMPAIARSRSTIRPGRQTSYTAFPWSSLRAWPLSPAKTRLRLPPSTASTTSSTSRWRPDNASPCQSRIAFSRKRASKRARQRTGERGGKIVAFSRPIGPALLQCRSAGSNLPPKIAYHVPYRTVLRQDKIFESTNFVSRTDTMKKLVKLTETAVTYATWLKNLSFTKTSHFQMVICILGPLTEYIHLFQATGV